MTKSNATRVKLLQGQIDRAIANGETHNACGVSMVQQIKSWEQLIKKAKRGK